MKGKVCVISGSRAEYGILKLIMRKIKAEDQLELQVLITGSHLSRRFGLTVESVQSDGFEIHKKCEIPLEEDSEEGVLRSLAASLPTIGAALKELSPELVIIVGDRYEIFGAAVAATLLHIPIAHIHGGEITLGAIDDVFRHSITKMASIHFTATAKYRDRVIQMGENPDNVFLVGAPGLEYIQTCDFMPRALVEEKLGLKLSDDSFVVAFHPETRYPGKTVRDLDAMLQAFDRFPDLHLVFTGSNADQDGRLFNRKIASYVDANSHRAVFHASLGQNLFLSTLRLTKGLIGNSSSGIIEAPSLAVGTLNVGARQEGRIRARTVIDSDASADSIAVGIERLLSEDFRDRLKNVLNPYFQENCSEKVISALKSFSVDGSQHKLFYDVAYS